MSTVALRLVGPRVVLRPMGRDDITETHLDWLRDPLVVRLSNQRFTTHTRESCLRYLEGLDSGPHLYLSVRRAEDDLALGTLTAYRQLHHGTADIGILMGNRSTWGQGLGAEAFRLLADWLASQHGMRKLTCGTLACNVGMLRAAAGAGFVEEGRRRAQELVDGVAHDVVLLARFVHPGA